ncbi:acetoacetate decarboxylase family protein [Micromonospora sp. KC723]|uniref:acetoacetate decarboxylase family protein n=1 Tax=Micromonospora sp. KC723 TaxID=2530381 RepID=UPI0014044C51|nr:acetoacetate decarboxylase family protein [Micromonospora sp. KC723]
MLDPADPQLVVDSRTLHVSWLPADPDGVAALVPPGLRPQADRQVFMNQYVVDDASQTSGFGAYSLTYLGVALVGVDAPGGATPGGWWTHYVTSSPRVRDYAAARGAPAVLGRTTVDIRGDLLVAETTADGEPVIRARARVGHTGHEVRRGHHRYFTTRDGELLSGVYPFISEPVTPFEIESVEFLAPGHPTYTMRPENPLLVPWGFYAPRTSFAYPGGLTPYPGHPAPAGSPGAGAPVP